MSLSYLTLLKISVITDYLFSNSVRPEVIIIIPMYDDCSLRVMD